MPKFTVTATKQWTRTVEAKDEGEAFDKFQLLYSHQLELDNSDEIGFYIDEPIEIKERTE